MTFDYDETAKKVTRFEHSLRNNQTFIPEPEEREDIPIAKEIPKKTKKAKLESFLPESFSNEEILEEKIEPELLSEKTNRQPIVRLEEYSVPAYTTGTDTIPDKSKKETPARKSKALCNALRQLNKNDPKALKFLKKSCRFSK